MATAAVVPSLNYREGLVHRGFYNRLREALELLLDVFAGTRRRVQDGAAAVQEDVGCLLFTNFASVDKIHVVTEDGYRDRPDAVGDPVDPFVRSLSLPRWLSPFRAMALDTVYTMQAELIKYQVGIEELGFRG